MKKKGPAKKRKKARGNAISSKRSVVGRLLDKYGNNCWACGQPMGDDVTIEHVIPQASGGGNNIDNLRLCHQRCNVALANHTPAEKQIIREKLHERANSDA